MRSPVGPVRSGTGRADDAPRRIYTQITFACWRSQATRLAQNIRGTLSRFATNGALEVVVVHLENLDAAGRNDQPRRLESGHSLRVPG